MKFFRIVTILLLLLVLFPAKAVGIANGSDEIYLEKPIENALVTGVYSVRWFMNDYDRTRIPFEVSIFSKSCKQNGPLFGTIAEGEAQQGEGFYAAKWDTDGPIIDKSNIPDGSYCLRICAVFIQSGPNYYALCDKKTVRVANSENRPPVIKSTAPAKNYTIGDTFEYDVNAEDPDNEKLTYEFAEAPDFLQIDKDSGLIKSKVALDKSGSYQVKVVVKDERDGAADQLFSITVNSDTSSGNITILFPENDDIVSKNNNDLSWKTEGINEVAKVNISYSKDGKDWKEITTSDKGDLTNFKWDLTGLESGDYYIRISITDKEGKLFEKVSEKFLLSNDSGGESIPLITIVRPLADSKISERKPVIQVKIAPSNQAKIDTEKITVKLNDSELTLCDKKEDEVSCQVQEDLQQGLYNVEVSLEDTAGKKAVRQWAFEVTEDGTSVTTTPTPSPTDQSGFPFLGRAIPEDTLRAAGLILCIGLLLLLVPWLIFTLISKRRQRDNNSYSETNNNYAVNDFIPAEPVQPSVITTDDTVFAPSIGTQSLDDQYFQPAPAAIPAQASVKNYDTNYNPAGFSEPPVVNTPSVYNESDLPSWLTSPSTEASQPVAPGGDNFQSANSAPVSNAVQEDSAKPYGDFGLAPQSDSE